MYNNDFNQRKRKTHFCSVFAEFLIGNSLYQSHVDVAKLLDVKRILGKNICCRSMPGQSSLDDSGDSAMNRWVHIESISLDNF